MGKISIVNEVQRRLSDMFGSGFFGGRDLKHNHYKDFGFPDYVDFKDTYGMYRRNSLAKAAVEKTTRKVWQDFPAFWTNSEPEETPEEKEVRQHLEKIHFWQAVMEADRRSYVGRYSAVILRFADGLPFSQPAANVAGVTGLVGAIPVWELQLRVSSWDDDPRSPTYGEPLMYEFNESAVPSVGQNAQSRSFSVHPSRVVIWSNDGTVHGFSPLEAGYNELLTLEKISGAGGEGFWKNAKSAPVLEIDKEASLQQMAQTMGVGLEDVYDTMNDQVRSYQQGFDELLMVQGMMVKSLQVRLPSPEHFFNISLQSFAACWGMPVKILVGTQTGERASQEDAKEWNYFGQSIRIEKVIPRLTQVLQQPADGWCDTAERVVREVVHIDRKFHARQDGPHLQDERHEPDERCHHLPLQRA
jgi:uncharacterized protein